MSVQPDHLLGVGEVADLLGLSKQRIHQLSRTKDFPEPVVRLKATPVWLRSDIEEYDKGRRLHAGPCCPCMKISHVGPCCPCAERHDRHCICVTSQRRRLTTYAPVTDANAPETDR